MGESRKIVVRIRLSWPSRFSTGRGPISGNCGTYFITAPLDIQASAITSVRSDRIRLAQVRPPAPQSVVDHRRRGYESRFGKIKFSLLSGVGVIACSSLVDAASAQVPAGTAITSAAVPIHDPTGDIVVTARRTAERLQDVPLSVTAIDAQSLDERNVRNVADLPAVAPGLSAQVSGSGTSIQFSIRGQGLTLGQSAPGVVPYFAEVPEFSTQFYDLEGVQVLKGPQGTLFGRNTTGGAILFSPRQPDNEFGGFITGRFGTYNRHDIEFGVGGAIIPDKIMVRFAGQMLRRKGYSRNLAFDERVNGEHKDSFRVSLLLRPIEALENYTIYENTDIDENGNAQISSDFT